MILPTSSHHHGVNQPQARVRGARAGTANRAILLVAIFVCSVFLAGCTATPDVEEQAPQPLALAHGDTWVGRNETQEIRLEIGDAEELTWREAPRPFTYFTDLEAEKRWFVTLPEGQVLGWEPAAQPHSFWIDARSEWHSPRAGPHSDESWALEGLILASLHEEQCTTVRQVKFCRTPDGAHGKAGQSIIIIASEDSAELTNGQDTWQWVRERAGVRPINWSGDGDFAFFNRPWESLRDGPANPDHLGRRFDMLEAIELALEDSRFALSTAHMAGNASFTIEPINGPLGAGFGGAGRQEWVVDILDLEAGLGQTAVAELVREPTGGFSRLVSLSDPWPHAYPMASLPKATWSLSTADRVVQSLGYYWQTVNVTLHEVQPHPPKLRESPYYWSYEIVGYSEPAAPFVASPNAWRLDYEVDSLNRNWDLVARQQS